jgi:type IV pilus assembly protein PilY1
MKLFFDAYPEQRGHDFNDGQPIALSPVLSVDLIGNVTIALSTGDQELLVPSGTHYIWSLTEKVDELTGTTFVSDANWFKPFTDGERVAGPISLFNSALFFATFAPETDPSAACSVGTSRVWGMHYIDQHEDGIDQGGAPRLPDPTSTTNPLVQFIDGTDLVTGGNATIFGVSVAQQPTCAEPDDTFEDPFLGLGSHTSITNVNPGQFQLIMQTGTGGQAEAGGTTNVQILNLPAPVNASRIDSWAGIIE